MIGEQGGFGLVSLLRGLLGIITILGIAYAMSYDRKRIDWKLVGGGLFMQIVFALAVICAVRRKPIGRMWQDIC